MDWVIGQPEDLKTVSEKDRHGKPLRTVIDMRTGLVRNDPIPDDETLAKFYSEDYRVEYKGQARPRKRQILRNFRRAAVFYDKYADVMENVETVLDAGAGSGEFLYLASKIAKSAKGIEPNREYAQYCKDELGLDVTTAHFHPDVFPAGSFDLILLNHVLEHLNDPVRYLALLRDWLSDTGVIYVEIPDIDQMCHYHSRGNMFHFGHIFNFNPWTVRAVAGMAGLVELEQTKDRCGNTTGVFFQRGEVRQAGENRANADETLRRIKAHYAGEYSKGALKKPFKKIAGQIEETLASGRYDSPQEIGNLFVKNKGE